jgi:hypothetical protein
MREHVHDRLVQRRDWMTPENTTIIAVLSLVIAVLSLVVAAKLLGDALVSLTS